MDEQEVFDILEVENILKNCDITVRNADGSFRLMNEVLKDLAEKWNECHEYIFAEIDEEESIVILSGYEDCQDDDFDIESYENEIYGNVGDFSESPSLI